MTKTQRITNLAMISGHLKGIADGLRWYETDLNKEQLQNCADMLRKDSDILYDICQQLWETTDD